MQHSPAKLLAALSRLMSAHPAYASYLKTSRDAIVGAQSPDGVHGIILRALAGGANTYADLLRETPYSRSYLHRHLKQLIKNGQVYSCRAPKSGDGQPQKLYFLTEKEPKKTVK